MSESNEIANRTFDQIAGVSRVAIGTSTQQQLIDTELPIYYIGTAYAGASQSDTKSWLLEKVDLTSNPYVITHATDSWANRASATYS